MTRKRFTKLLRSWRYSEKDIAMLVKAVAGHPVGISYDTAMKFINRYLIKELFKVEEKPIDYNFRPIEYVDTKEFCKSDYQAWRFIQTNCLDTRTFYTVKVEDTDLSL